MNSSVTMQIRQATADVMPVRRDTMMRVTIMQEHADIIQWIWPI